MIAFSRCDLSYYEYEGEILYLNDFINGCGWVFFLLNSFLACHLYLPLLLPLWAEAVTPLSGL